MVDSAVEIFRREISRTATVLEIGGFRPPLDPFSSWFGDVTVCLPGEVWPCTEGKPMLALAQINLLEFQTKPPGLNDIDLLTMFIGSGNLPMDAPNGEGWAIRAYKDISDLIPVEKMETGSVINKLPMRSTIVGNDYPCWDDVTGNVPEEFEDSYDDLFPNVNGFKFGGWPTLIQSEIFWAPWNKHAAKPEYVFQIDSTVKGNWAWGDAGVGYIGRGTAAGRTDDWALAWQCM